MYEHRSARLLPWPAFLRRAFRHLLASVLTVAIVVGAGTVGYHLLDDLPWIDAFLNASMILSGMGPVDKMATDAAKLFAAIYALFSGLLFVALMGLVLAPWLHRLLHTIHLEGGAKE
jgi:hypothetical protein